MYYKHTLKNLRSGLDERPIIHLPLFAGTIDWRNLMEIIKKYASQTVFVFEYADGNYKNAADMIKKLDIVRKKLRI